MFVPLSKTFDLFVSPLTWALLFGLAGLLTARRRPLSLGLGAVGLVVLYLASVGAVADPLERRLEAGGATTERPDVVYDAAVVLSGAVDDAASRRSGEMELNAAGERVLAALDLWRAGRARVIALVGGPVAPEPGAPTEPERVAAALRRWGVPAEAIVVETKSRNTHENAVAFATIARERGFRSLLLVTSAWHMPRALGCFRRVGLSPDALAVDHRAAAGWGWEPRSEFLERTTFALHEYAGRVVYALAGYTR